MTNTDFQAQIEAAFGPMVKTPVFKPAMRLTRNGWMVQCRECEGDHRGHTIEWDGMGMGAQHIVESRWQCEHCDGGWNEARADDFDEVEVIVDGRKLRAFPHDGGLIGLDDDDNEYPIASIDNIQELAA